MTANGPRPDVVRAQQRLPKLYVAALASLPKGTGPRVAGGGRWAPPAPLNLSVYDLIGHIEWASLQLESRSELILGFRPNGGQLQDACPYCDQWALWYRPNRGIIEVIRCAACTATWRGRAGWLELAALLTARDQETADQSVAVG